ncbi:MAG: ABC transporter permease [Armatimonadetes bacterium]|nr:ABC transporter permease [Armatimonadota bacterium]
MALQPAASRFDERERTLVAEPARRQGWRVSLLARLARRRAAAAGLALLVVLLASAVFAPRVSPHDPVGIAPQDARVPPGPAYWFGTDQFGRDVFSRVLYGGRTSLGVGLIAVAIGAIPGTLLGLVAGYRGGRSEAVIMHVMDLLLAFPGILLALVIVAALGPGLAKAMIAVGIASIPRFTRVVHATVLSAKQNLYVEAARAIGAGETVVMFRHILPNVFAPLVVLSTLGVGLAILNAAALSFLGLGAQPPTPEWGAMVAETRDYLRAAWWASTFPGLAIMLAVLAVNLVGDGLRDVLDPRLRLR